MAQRISFLVHTRSRSFDYGWIYGLRDRAEEGRLADFLLNWLGSTQLANLPPVSAFFRVNGKLMILVARQSESRVDNNNRPIFERASFYWSESEHLTYRHIRSLYRRLLKEAEGAFNDVPNDEVRSPRNVLDLNVELEELEEQDQRESDDTLEWTLPDDLEGEDLLSVPLVVETPSSWGFAKLIEPIADMPIRGAKAIFLGSSLPLAHKFDEKCSWIISPPGESSRISTPRVVDAKGNAIPKEEIRKLLRVTHVPSQLLMARGRPSGREDELRGNIVGEKDIKGDDSLAKLLDNVADRNRETDGDTGNWVTRSLGLGKGRPMRDVMLRLSLLIGPLELDCGPDLVFAWTNLLAEIALFTSRCSPEIGRHWAQRLRYLASISSANYGRQSKKWAEEFSAACAELEDLIGFR